MADNPINDVTTPRGAQGRSSSAHRWAPPASSSSRTSCSRRRDKVYDDISAGKFALENGQIDGLVVDTPTAFYIRDAELEDFDTPEPEGAVIGQIVTETRGHFGIVLDKDSPLTACVNEALAAIKASGQYQEIYDTWISDAERRAGPRSRESARGRRSRRSARP